MDLTAIKQEIDLPGVVQQAGIQLKKSGSRYVGLCPFHADVTPSFFVFPDKHFHCFACQEHGDVFDFLEKLYGCTHKEALRILGVKPGPVSQKQRTEIRQRKHRQELVNAFRRWEIEVSTEVAMLCRCCRKVVGHIKSEANLDKYGNRYHDLEVYEYHLDILTGNDEEAKFGLYDAKYYG